MDNSLKEEYLLLRGLIGFLGEKSRANWWSTDFFSASFDAFLSPIVPKSTRVAQYHGVCEAARRIHDKHIGIGRVHHLFRLPEEQEQDLHRLIASKQDDAGYFNSFDSKESAFEMLSKLANGNGSEKEGPVRVGELDLISSRKSIGSISQLYLKAFESDKKIFPYFAE